MTPKKQYYKNAAETVIKNLEKRNMQGFYCDTAADAVALALSLMPEGSSVSYGGSMSLSESGLMDAVRAGNYHLIVREDAKTKEEQKAMYAEMVNSDFFLMSTNAITLDGELVNVDGRANRVSFLCFGPENVIMIVGMNKVAADLDSAMKRARNTAAPMNTVRLSRNTPCAVTGKCADCQSPDCICAQTVITRRSHIKNRIKVILVGEELGY